MTDPHTAEALATELRDSLDKTATLANALHKLGWYVTLRMDVEVEEGKHFKAKVSITRQQTL